MGIILWIVIGGIAGWLASMIMRTNSTQGPLQDIILGVLGALVGGFLFGLVGQPGFTGFNLYSLVVATLGAAILIWLGRFIHI